MKAYTPQPHPLERADLLGAIPSEEIVLYRTKKNRWITYNWSAFLVRLLLGAERCHCYPSGNNVCVEIDGLSLYHLSTRVEVVSESEWRILLYSPPLSSPFLRLYPRWKSGLRSADGG